LCPEYFTLPSADTSRRAGFDVPWQDGNKKEKRKIMQRARTKGKSRSNAESFAGLLPHIEPSLDFGSKNGSSTGCDGLFSDLESTEGLKVGEKFQLDCNYA